MVGNRWGITGISIEIKKKIHYPVGELSLDDEQPNENNNEKTISVWSRVWIKSQCHVLGTPGKLKEIEVDVPVLEME